MATDTRLYVRVGKNVQRWKSVLMALLVIISALSSLAANKTQTHARGVATMVKDINLGGASEASSFVTLGSVLFFIADDGIHGRELWRSDGTEAGTTMVADIQPGSENTFISRADFLTSFNGKLVFAADDGIHGRELWITDGTTNGTTLVKDIVPGAETSYINQLVVAGNVLFFVAEDGIHGAELWKSDGTAAGTILVKDITLNDNGHFYAPSGLANVNGTLFFSGNFGTIAGQLWKSNGTEVGTTLVKQIHSYAPSHLGQYTVANGIIFFTARDAEHGQELWKTDGTPNGTMIVKDINPISSGPFPGDPHSSWPTGLISYQGLLYFFADSNGSYAALWQSDGTSAGTVLVKDISAGNNSYPSSPVISNDQLFFSDDTASLGREPWISDGTTNGTMLLKDINPGSTGSFFELASIFGTIFLSPDDGVHGNELWISDGTEAGTVLLQDIAPGPLASYPSNFVYVNGMVLFTADDGVNGRELWSIPLDLNKVYIPLIQR